MTAARAEAAALTAELAITMRHKPDDFFEHTDLLDFPDYRSRLKTDDVARELAKPDQLRQFFLRGKVAYLFERYKTDLELTSMLLCIGPSNQEVQDLPAVISDWVSDAAGKSPELRRGRRTTLFLVLTKFDMEFEKKKGALDGPTVCTRRSSTSSANSTTGPNSGPRIGPSTIPSGSVTRNSVGRRSSPLTANGKPASVPSRKPTLRT